MLRRPLVLTGLLLLAGAIPPIVLGPRLLDRNCGGESIEGVVFDCPASREAEAYAGLGVAGLLAVAGLAVLVIGLGARRD